MTRDAEGYYTPKEVKKQIKSVYPGLLETIGLVVLFYFIYPYACDFLGISEILFGIIYFGFFAIWGKSTKYWEQVQQKGLGRKKND